MTARFGGGREFKHLAGQLWDGETVTATCIGEYGKGMGLIVLTNRRLLTMFKGLIESSTEDFPLDKISSVQWNQGMAQGTLTVYASNNKVEIPKIVNKDGKALSDALRAATASQPAPTAPVEPAPPPTAGPPAGWYADPEGSPRTRWWDGARWTEHFQAASTP